MTPAEELLREISEGFWEFMQQEYPDEWKNQLAIIEKHLALARDDGYAASMEQMRQGKVVMPCGHPQACVKLVPIAGHEPKPSVQPEDYCRWCADLRVTRETWKADLERVRKEGDSWRELVKQGCEL